MNRRRAAEIQVVLEGIRLPATREELVRYAAGYDGSAANELALLPQGSYRDIDQVGEALSRTQKRETALEQPI